MAYRLEKYIPVRNGVFVQYGGTYKYMWSARVARWFSTMCPDLRHHIIVEIVEID